MMKDRAAHDMSFFADPGDEAGVFFDDFVVAVGVWSWMQQGDVPPTVRAAAQAFCVTDDVIRKAIDAHPWCFLSGPDDDATKQLIEADGE